MEPLYASLTYFSIFIKYVGLPSFNFHLTFDGYYCADVSDWQTYEQWFGKFNLYIVNRNIKDQLDHAGL